MVSCIMPTHNRRALVPQAIRYFLRQDLTESELIVLDDGTDSVGDLMPDDPRIRYIRLPERHTIGQKRNIGCAQAWGEIIVHWDDDDWMASWRLSHQVESLQSQGVDVSGLRSLLCYQVPEGKAWRYECPDNGRPWVAGATFCHPQVASVGLTEAAAKEAGHEIKVGKQKLGGVGGATVYDDKDGLVKLVVDSKYGEILGAHIVGNRACDMIAELVATMALEGGYQELSRIVHPHPTVSETVLDAARAVDGWAIHA